MSGARDQFVQLDFGRGLDTGQRDGELGAASGPVGGTDAATMCLHDRLANGQPQPNAAAAIGVGLYYWWFHSLNKTPPVFVVLIFLVVCTVASLIIAMVQNKPLVSAVSVALMSAPLAAVGAAAVLHGLYFCDRAGRCLMGLIPY